MGRRTPCREKLGMKKGSWTPEEDEKLLAYIEEHGHGSWRALPAKAGLQRCGKSCRLRWNNYLRPDIKRGKFSLKEEQTIIQLHALLGNRWSTITTLLPKRTDNEIKNYWNTHLKKKLAKMGIDPVTHKPKSNTLSNIAGNSKAKDVANLSHMAQWESARLEAEARLVRESNQVVLPPSNNNINNIIIPIQKNQLISSSSFSAAAYQLNNKPVAAAAPTTTTLTTMIPPCLDVLKAWQAMWSKSTRDDDGAVSGNLTGGLGNDLGSNSTTAVNFVASSSSIASSLHDMQYYFSEGVWTTDIESKNNLLLPNNLIHNSSCDHNSWAAAAEENTNNGVGSCGGLGDFEDPKDYWSGILAFVNSRPTPDSLIMLI